MQEKFDEYSLDTPRNPIDICDAFGDRTAACPNCYEPVRVPLVSCWAGNAVKTIRCWKCRQLLWR